MILDAKGNPIVIEKQGLTAEMASFASAIGQTMAILPDPDPVLRQRGDDQTVLAALMADQQVTSLSQLRARKTLAKADYGFSPWQPDKGKKPEGKAADLCAALTDDLMAIRLKSVFGGVINANLYGYTVFELLWRAEGNRLRLVDIVEKPREWFGFDGDGALFFQKTGERITPPYGKFVLARHEPSYQNPYGVRLLTRCLWPVAFKQMGVEWYLRFLKRYGMPWQVATAPQGYDQKQRRFLAESLASMVEDAVAVLPNGAEHQLVSAGGDGGNGYIDFLNFWNAEIAKVLSCQTQSSELTGKTGSYASSQTHYEVLEDVALADEGLIRDTMNSLAVIYAAVNGQPDCPPVFAFEEATDYVAQAELDQKRWAVGVRFTKAHFLRYGLEEDEFEMASEAPPGAGQIAFSRRGGPLCPPNTGQPRGVAPTIPSFNFTEDDPSQQALDAMIDRVVAKLDNHFADLDKMVGQAEDYDALDEALAGFAGQPLDAAATPLRDTLLAAQIFGRYSIAATQTASRDHAGFSFDALPPTEALQWWQNKVPMSRSDFDRLSADAKAQAFTVSGLTRLEDISLVHREIGRAITLGKPLRQFQSEMGERLNGQLSNQRLATIYRTNVQSAYQSGRYSQMMAVAADMPWWRYVAVGDQRTRPEHRALNGIVRRFDDPFWDTHYPPNGFNCRCTVQALADRQVDRKGYERGEGPPAPVDIIDENTGEITPTIGRPDAGWETNAAKATWQPDLGKFRADLKQGMLTSLGQSLRDDTTAWPRLRRRLKQDDLDDMETALWAKDKAHDQAFGEWAAVVAASLQPKGELFPVGNIPIRILRKLPQQPRLALVTIDDDKLVHMIREAKTARDKAGKVVNAALTLDEIKQIPQRLRDARWFWDTEKENALFAWLRVGDQRLKVVVQMDYRIGNRSNLLANHIITSGVILEENLSEYKEL